MITKEEIAAALAFTGALLGAGFGSGRELWHFFARFGLWGVVGVILAGLLFMGLAGAVLTLSGRYHCRDHRDFCQALLPRSLAVVGDWVFSLFLFAGIGIMLAGGAALAKDHFGLPPWLGVVLVWLPSFWAVAGRQKGVFASQKILVPLLLAGISLVSLIALLGPGTPVGTTAPLLGEMPLTPGLAGDDSSAGAGGAGLGWLGFSCLYVGYNMLGGAALLSGLAGDQGNSRPIGRRAGLLGGGLVGLAAILPVLALVHTGAYAGRYELPLLYLAYQEGSWLFYLYSILFAAALISTVIANAYCLCQRFEQKGRSHLRVLLVILVLALPLAGGSFSALVASLYGACGWAGIGLFAAMAWGWFIQRRGRT